MLYPSQETYNKWLKHENTKYEIVFNQNGVHEVFQIREGKSKRIFKGILTDCELAISLAKQDVEFTEV